MDFKKTVLSHTVFLFLGFYFDIIPFSFYLYRFLLRGFPGSLAGKESTCNAGDPGLKILGWEDPLEKGTATCSSILAWRITWTCIVHVVVKSWTRLSDFHFDFMFLLSFLSLFVLNVFCKHFKNRIKGIFNRCM